MIINKEIPFERSFASNIHVEEWDYIKNNKNPRDVFKCSHKKYHFKCKKCNHSFKSTLNHVSNGKWCPYCGYKILCNDGECKFCLERSFASNIRAEEWNYTKNDKNPRDVSRCSGRKFWFVCKECNHPFKSVLADISNGKWCPFCANQKLCGNKECKICFERSFASNIRAEEWNYTKNDKNPRDVSKYSNRKYQFKCKECNHSFESILHSISGGSWCPYCKNKFLCNDKKCQICFGKSFASNIHAEEWDYIENDKNPRQVSKYSNKKYKFKCKECSHSFESILDSISNGRWCPFCGNQKLCDNTECDFCFKKSFSSHQKANFWSEKNKTTPRQVFKSSGNKYWFRCDKCSHEFEQRLDSITCQDCWCSFCVNKTEQKLYDYLIQLYPSLQRQYRAEWCKKKKYLPFDFVIEELKIIIELDGPQHFKQISNWESPENQHENDKFKMKCANNNRFSVIRLLQEDVLDDIYDWKNNLVQSIEILRNGNNIRNIYLFLNDEYNFLL